VLICFFSPLCILFLFSYQLKNFDLLVFLPLLLYKVRNDSSSHFSQLRRYKREENVFFFYFTVWTRCLRNQNVNLSFSIKKELLTFWVTSLIKLTTENSWSSKNPSKTIFMRDLHTLPKNRIRCLLIFLIWILKRNLRDAFFFYIIYNKNRMKGI
jgi:hypothetical protein